jgi:hypothetical protein
MPGPLDAAIDACGRLTEQISTTTPEAGGDGHSTDDVSGVQYNVITQKYRQVVDVVDHAFVTDIGMPGVWPGQILQGESLNNGDIAPFGSFPRMQGTIQVSGLVAGKAGPKSSVIPIPKEDAVSKTLEDLIGALAPTDTVGATKSDYSQAYTYEQVGLSFDLNVKGTAFSVDAKASLNQDFKSTTIVATIRQTYYTVEFTPDAAGGSGIWQTAGPNPVTINDIQPYMRAGTPGNPPVLVNSVQYGRLIVLAVTSAHSSSDVKATLEAHYKNVVEAGATLNADQQKIIDTCTAQIYTIGVPGRNSFQDIANPAVDLPKVYTAGNSLSWPNNPGAVVSFTCLHVADNILAHVGLTAEYVQPVSIGGADVHGSSFTWFDGKGSTPTVTNIELNPGGNLKIQASGQIWAGVFGSGDNGPDGWGPGHPPNQNAPVPPSRKGTSAYCLVARIGNSDWFEAKSLWESQVADNQQGTLVFASNDNVWSNGDPKKHWTITVDVTRTSANSVGLYA